METKYIEELYNKSLQKEMEIEFEKKNPFCKATFKVLSNFKQMKIAIFDRDFKYIKSYIATEYDCIPEEFADTYYKDYPKSAGSSSDNHVRKFYLRFIKNHFEKYAEDYKKHLIEQADLDLGETTTL